MIWKRSVGPEVANEVSDSIAPDKNAEHERLSKEIDRIKNLAESTRIRLTSDSFVDKAPPAVVQKEQEKYQGILQNLEKLENNRAALQD